MRVRFEKTSTSYNSLATVADRWTPTHPSNTIAKATNSTSIVTDDRFVENASFLRVKNITLGYNLPVRQITKDTKARLFISLQNLITWTSYSGCAIRSHLEYFRATNMDFVKVQYEIAVPRLENIKSPKDWAKIPVYKKDFFAPQLDVIEALVKELKSEALILPTVYSPLSLAQQTIGSDAVQHIKQDPDAVSIGFKAITESILNYMNEAIRIGVDGFYISTQGGNSMFFDNGILFEKVIVPYDKIISQEASDKALMNILHVCDYGEAYYRQISQFATYPGSIINAPNQLLDGTPIKPQEVQSTFKRPVMGGLDRLGILAKGSILSIIILVDPYC